MSESITYPPAPDRCWRDPVTHKVLTPHNTRPEQISLKQLVRGIYDMQKLRIATGNRLCAQVRTRLGQAPGVPADEALSPAVRQLLEDIKEAHKKLSSGIAKKSSKVVEDVATTLDESETSEVEDLEDDLEDDEEDGGKKKKGINEKLLKLIKAEYDDIIVNGNKKKKKKGEKDAVIDIPADTDPVEVDPLAVSTTPKLPSKRGFKGRLAISQYIELLLASSYIELEQQIDMQEARLKYVLEDFQIYNEFLDPVRGCGPKMGAVIVALLDPYLARSPSSFWRYCGLDVVNGEGHNRSEEHMVTVKYVDKDGEVKDRKSIGYNPEAKTLIGYVLATCILKSGLRRVKDAEGNKTKQLTAISKYAQIFLDYRSRLEHHEKYGTHNDTVIDEARTAAAKKKNPKIKKIMVTGKGRRMRMAMRYMMKMFLMDLHIAWRKVENLPVTLPYHEAKLGRKHGGKSAAE